jgi:hypothetical protein
VKIQFYAIVDTETKQYFQDESNSEMRWTANLLEAMTFSNDEGECYLAISELQSQTGNPNLQLVWVADQGPEPTMQIECPICETMQDATLGGVTRGADPTQVYKLTCGHVAI